MNNKHRFRPGDIVRVKEWDDMVDEFGLTNGDRIDCGEGLYFLYDMSCLCGNEYTVKSVQTVTIAGHEYTRIILEEQDLWRYSSGMFVPADSSAIDVDLDMWMALL